MLEYGVGARKGIILLPRDAGRAGRADARRWRCGEDNGHSLKCLHQGIPAPTGELVEHRQGFQLPGQRWSRPRC